LRDFFLEDNVFVAYGHEKHSVHDFDLTNDGTVQLQHERYLSNSIVIFSAKEVA